MPAETSVWTETIDASRSAEFSSVSYMLGFIPFQSHFLFRRPVSAAAGRASPDTLPSTSSAGAFCPLSGCYFSALRPAVERQMESTLAS